MFDVKLPNIKWLEERGSMEHIFSTDPSQEQGLIMLYGPSNFTRWSNKKWGMVPAEEAIRMKDGSSAVVNHGFGTSTTEEQLYYYPRCVRPWAPRAMVTVSLGNDLSAGYTVDEVLSLFARLMQYARTDFPGIKLYTYNRLPNIRTRDAKPERFAQYMEYNQKIKAYCDEHDDVTLIDFTKFPSLFQEGHVGDYAYPREELYVEDGTHFNQAGYDVYRDIFLEVLDDIL